MYDKHFFSIIIGSWRCISQTATSLHIEIYTHCAPDELIGAYIELKFYTIKIMIYFLDKLFLSEYLRKIGICVHVENVL